MSTGASGPLPQRRYKVFVSYRHADKHAAARIVDFLIAVFGRSAIFHDIQSIPAGQDFRTALRQAVADSELVLAVVGPTWIESFSPSAVQARGDEPDWVVVELEQAFSLGIRVVPAVIHPAGMPPRESLPAGIQELAFRQCRMIWPDLAFENSVHQLVDEIQVILGGVLPGQGVVSAATRGGSANDEVVRPTTRRTWLIGALLCASLVVAGGAWFALRANSGNAAVGFKAIPLTPAQKAQIEKSVNAIRAGTDRPIEKRSESAVVQPTLGTPDFSTFEVLDDEFTWDLRGVRPRAKEDPPLTSYAILTRRIRLRKIGETRELRFESRTSGTDLFLRSSSHPDSSIEYVSESPKFTGMEALKVRQLGIDVSDVPVGKELNVSIEATYWDSLQTAEERWVGAQGYSQSDVIRFLVIFPEQRKFTACRLKTAKSRRDPPIPFTGECVYQEDKERGFVFWEIPFPELDRIYRCEWDW